MDGKSLVTLLQPLGGDSGLPWNHFRINITMQKDSKYVYGLNDSMIV